VREVSRASCVRYAVFNRLKRCLRFARHEVGTVFGWMGPAKREATRSQDAGSKDKIGKDSRMGPRWWDFFRKCAH
jgi:hypothetical protein